MVMAPPVPIFCPISQPRKMLGTEDGQLSTQKAVDGAMGAEAMPWQLDASQWYPTAQAFELHPEDSEGAGDLQLCSGWTGPLRESG